MRYETPNAAPARTVIVQPPSDANDKWIVFVQSGAADSAFTFGERSFESQAWADRYAATLQRVFGTTTPPKVAA